MKKILIFVLAAVMLGVSIPAFAGNMSASSAVTQTRTHRRHKRTFWRKHRDKLTVAGGAVGGAAIGGLAGGKKGALIGAAAGGGGGALYTYKLRHRRHRRHRKP
jgi:uncharacterized protein YcfJ